MVIAGQDRLRGREPILLAEVVLQMKFDAFFHYGHEGLVIQSRSYQKFLLYSLFHCRICQAHVDDWRQRLKCLAYLDVWASLILDLQIVRHLEDVRV